MSFFNDNGLRYLAALIKAELNEKVSSSAMNSILLEREKAKNPVGTILVNTSGANPATYLGFGTWIAWGTGRVPVGVNADDTNFNTVEKTGGAKSVDLSHAHTVNSHVHTGPSHKHTVDAHAHSTGNHTLTVSEIPAHAHTVTRNFPYGQDWGGGSAWSAYSSYQHSPNNMTMVCSSTGGGGAHNHGNTGSASPSTSAAGTGNTGAAAPGTNSKLSAAQSILQPYITCYMWKRTA